MAESISELLHKISIFSILTDEQIKRVAYYIDFIELNQEATVFFEGWPGEFVCFVVEGALDVTKKSVTTGQETNIGTISQGDIVGEMALIDDMNRSATVTAKTDSKLLILTKDRFDKLLNEDPYTGVEILKGIAKNLSFHLRRTWDNLTTEA